MNRTLLTLSLILSTIAISSQIIISETLNGEDISGSQITLNGSPSDFDIEHTLYVSNAFSETVSMKVRRIEDDVLSNTYNNICWLICPAVPQYAGDNPDWVTDFTVTMDPGSVDSSFAIHYDPNDEAGCSLIRVQWVDATNNDDVLQEVFFRIIHGGQSCEAVGIEDVFADIEFSLSPNPSNDQAQLVLEGLERTMTVELFDVLGQKVLEDIINPSIQDRLTINTSVLRNGIYFLSLSDRSKTLKTVKMVVKH